MPSNMYLMPSLTSWCARQIKSRLLMVMKSLVTLWPNSQPAPRGLWPLKSNVSSSRTGCFAIAAVYLPVFHVLGIGPHQITEGAFVGYLAVALNCPYLIQRYNLRTEPAMHAQHALVNDLYMCKKQAKISITPPPTPTPSSHLTLSLFLSRTVRTAAMVSRSKTLQQYFQPFALPYLLKHSSKKPYTFVICRVSWLPRSNVIRLGYRALSVSRRVKVSRL